MSTPMAVGSASGRVLRVLYQYGQLTRAETTARSGLARSAVGNAVTELEEIGLLTLKEPVPQGRKGRPSPLLCIVPDRCSALVLQIAPREIHLVVVDLGMRHRSLRRITWNACSATPKATLETAAKAINDAFIELDPSILCGIAVSLPGVVDTDRGVAESILPLNWSSIPVVELLSPMLTHTVPITLGHDATFGALAEYRARHASAPKRLLYLTGEFGGIGSSVITRSTDPGFGAVVDYPLQAGHLCVDPAGNACECGSNGCLENYLKGSALTDALNMTSEASYKEIYDYLEQLDRAAVPHGVFDQPIHALKIGLISLINTLGPDVVVLAGLLAPIYRLFEEQLLLGIDSAIVARLTPTHLSTSMHNEATILGGAETAFGRVFAEPSILLSD